MANSFWRWIAVLGLVLASAVSALARPDEKLDAKLAELAAPLQVEGIIFIEGYAVPGGRIEWSVWYDRARIGPYLDQAGIDVANTEKAQLVSWYRDLNAKLLAAAQSAAKIVLGKDAIDPETDVETEFISTASLTAQGRVGSHQSTFRGSRIIDILSPPDGMGESDPPAVKPGAGVEVEIQPDRLIYAPGDTISGRFVIRNHAKRRVAIPDDKLPTVFVQTSQGKPAPTFPSRTFICGGSRMAESLVIEPGQSYTRSFSIDTDPLMDTGGVRMDVGRYHLKYPDLSQRFNVPTKTRPVTIEVRASADRPRLGSRIVDLAADERRITVRRENRLLETFDLHTGARLASLAIDEDRDNDSTWYMLRADRYAGINADGRLVIYTLSDNPPSVTTFTLPALPGRMQGQCRVQGFSADGDAVTLLQGQDCYHFDIPTRTFSEPTAVGGPYFQVSPDGDYVIRYEKTGATLTPLSGEGSGPEMAMPPTPGRSDTTRTLFGRRGQYMACEGSDHALLAMYDGSTPITFATSANTLVCESDDGGLVVFAHRQPLMDFLTRGPQPCGPLEVWANGSQDAAAGSPTKLFEINDGAYRDAKFAGDRLVCAVRTMRTSEWYHKSVSWLSPRLEIRDARTGQLERELILPDPAP